MKKIPFLAIVCWLGAASAAVAEDALKQIQAWVQAPDTCSREQLLGYLSSKDIRVRSAALDFLENVTGQDFGLDAWLAPDEVPQPVRDALRQWSELATPLVERSAVPTPQQTQEHLELLRTADPDTARRICLRYENHPTVLSVAIVQMLGAAADLPQEEQDRLRHAQYRIHLLSVLKDEAVPVATALTSHVRADTLDALESLRKAGVPALPVVMDFVAHSDALVREVAIDVLLDVGRNAAFDILRESLMAETDRNILQIAAKRLVDCKIQANIISFLKQCALSADEDIALAGLESLAALAESDTEDREGRPLTIPPDAMLSAEQCTRLLDSPHWRIRVAVLDLLSKSASFVHAVAKDESLQQKVVDLLRDEDETVRQYASTAIFKRRMALQNLEALTEYALSSPTMAPFVFALYCNANKKLPPALLELLSRMSVAEVERLISFDETQHLIFSDKDDNLLNYTAMMLALLKNPDAQVRSVLIPWVGRDMMAKSTDFADAVCEWLENPAIDFDSKYDFLTSSHQPIPFSHEERLVAWFKAQLTTEVAQEPNARTKLLNLLYRFDKKAAMAYVGPYVLQADSDTLESFIYDCTDLLFSFDLDTVVELINKKDADFFLRVINNDIDAAQNDKLMAWIRSPRIREDIRCRVFIDTAKSLYTEKSVHYGIVQAYLDAAVADNGASTLSQAVIVTICCQRDEIWDEFKNVARPVLPQLPAELRAFVQCVEDMPESAEAVEPWVKKYAASEYVSLRRVVACSLMPLAQAAPFWVCEGVNSTVFEYPHPMLGHPLKRVSCPVSLIRLIDAMQQDPDAFVSLFASASMLYRTGDCDRARFAERLAWLKEKSDAESRYDLYSHASYVLNGIWTRWHEHRYGVDEPFKLKGSPKKLKPGLDSLLVQLNTIAMNAWGLIPEVKKYLSTENSDGGRSTSSATADSFRFGGAVAPQASETQAPPPTLAGSEDADTEEEPIVTIDRALPVKVEFFHTKGCNDCKQALALLDALRTTYPKLQVKSFDIESDEGRQRNLVLCERYGVPVQQKRKAPILFAESGYVYGANITKDSVTAVLDAAIAGKQVAALPLPEQPQEQPLASPPTPDAPATDLLADTQATEAASVDAELKKQSFVGYLVLSLGAVLFLVAGFVLIFAGKRKRSTDS